MDQPAPTIISGLKQKENKQTRKVHKESSKDVVRGEKEIININRQAGQHLLKVDKQHKLDKVAMLARVASRDSLGIFSDTPLS